MAFFINDDYFKIEVLIDESVDITSSKYPTKPVIVVRSSYEHEQGDSDTSRSRHRPGIKLKKGSVYGKYGLEVFTTDEDGNVKATPVNNKKYDDSKDKKIVNDFINKYHEEIDRIYNAKPKSQEYEDAINDLLEKNDGKYIMRRNKQ